MNIKNDTGDQTYNDITATYLNIETDTGDTKLTNTIIQEDFTFIGGTGNVLFDGFDAKNIDMELSTGDVKGTILTGKVFDAHSDTGKVIVPENKDGGNCKINVSTGDIYISYK